ncbi:serine/threonine-protein kinase pakC-like [Mya arenaria]|uniref:serine/threonine-protein kinase pakC-like n=1 Tax=Mya arenaria TaxID=6604 RepID=UPI0022E4BC29|nr:serine/threonine-protein kinase pakC-like [Mya arenaria]
MIFKQGEHIKSEPDAQVVGRSIARDKDKGQKDAQLHVPPTQPKRESFSSNRDIRTDLPVISGDTFKVAFEQALYRINRRSVIDMTPKQVLLNYQNGKDCVAKLSAFGLSKIKNNVDMTSSVAGAKTNQKSAIPRYSAPEVLSGEILKIPDIMKADIWSLALLLHEVIFEEEPYFDMSYKTLLKEVGTKGVTPKGLSDVHTDDTVSVAQKRALSFNPAKRPDITYICQILKDIDNIYKDCA